MAVVPVNGKCRNIFVKDFHKNIQNKFTGHLCKPRPFSGTKKRRVT